LPVVQVYVEHAEMGGGSGDHPGRGIHRGRHGHPVFDGGIIPVQVEITDIRTRQSEIGVAGLDGDVLIELMKILVACQPMRIDLERDAAQGIRRYLTAAWSPTVICVFSESVFGAKVIWILPFNAESVPP